VIEHATVGPLTIPRIAGAPFQLQAQVIVLERLHGRDAAARHARDADDRATIDRGDGEDLVGILVETDDGARDLLLLVVHPRPEVGIPAGQILAVEEFRPARRGARGGLAGLSRASRRNTRKGQSGSADSQSHRDRL
jgi:hypothetical protein